MSEAKLVAVRVWRVDVESDRYGAQRVYVEADDAAAALALAPRAVAAQCEERQPATDIDVVRIKLVLDAWRELQS